MATNDPLPPAAPNPAADPTPPIYDGPPKTSSMAVASLVLGLTSFLCLIFTGIPAIICGLMALSKIGKSGGALSGKGMALGGVITGGFTSLLFVPGILIALLMPAVQAAREAARAAQSMNHEKQIVLGMLNYESARGQFPAAGSMEPGSESQLSWRVHLLPYLELGGAELYDQFHLDEPWDSPHNKQLILQMPDIYQCPNFPTTDGSTQYLAVTGAGTAFEDGKSGATLRSFEDGMSYTVVLVEVNSDQAVPWTKPSDWTFDPEDPLRGLGSVRPRVFVAGFADGSVQRIATDTPPEQIGAMMTRAGGERVDVSHRGR